MSLIIFGKFRVVRVAMPHRLFEDRRVGGDAGQPVLIDQRLQSARRQKLAIDKVQPDRLAMRFQIVEAVPFIHSFVTPALSRGPAVVTRRERKRDPGVGPGVTKIQPINSFATFTTLSTVKPNLSASLASGAEAPNVAMLIALPSRPM